MYRKGAEAAGKALDILGTADAKQQALETRRRADREKTVARSAPENARQTLPAAAASAGRASRNSGVQGPEGGRSGLGADKKGWVQELDGQAGLAEQVLSSTP